MYVEELNELLTWQNNKCKKLISCKGDGLTKINTKMTWVLKISYLGHYVKVKEWQNKDKFVDI
jgi:hypothetical protein